MIRNEYKTLEKNEGNPSENKAKYDCRIVIRFLCTQIFDC